MRAAPRARETPEKKPSHRALRARARSQRELLVASVLYIIGALIEALAALPSLGSTTGLTILIVGRWTYGIACGFGMHGAPTYIGEMAPASIRGFLVSLKEGMIVLGIPCGYLVSSLRHRAGAWASRTA